MRRLLLPPLAAAAVALAACGGSDTPTTGPVTNPPPAVAVASVDVAAPAGGALVVGRTATVTATVRDAAGNALAGRAVTWTADPAAVATVDANGVVTALTPGTVTITATSEGRSARVALTVAAPSPAAVSSVTIAGASATLRVGDTVRLAAVARDSAGAVLAGRTIRWSSSAPVVASVDSASGLVTALRPGQATLTAASEGRSATHAVTVAAAAPAPAPVRTVTVGTALDTLEAYDVVQLAATVRDSANNVLADRAVRWTSSNPAVATVDSVTGRLTGVDRGTVTVTATSEGRTGTATRVVVIRYRSLTTGSEHACDIASGGIAWCWGRNSTQGRLGSGQTGASDAHSNVPVRVAGDHRFAQLSTYGNTTCGVTREGALYCWGSNAAYALGAASNVSQSPTPVPVVATQRFKQVAVSGTHSCALTTDGRAYCWGPNSSGQLGTGNTTWAQTPVAAAAGLTFATLTAGTEYTCGLTPAGAAHCWGVNGLGQLGDGLRPSMGNTQTNAPVAVVGGHTFRTLSASSQLTCGVTTADQALCWGRGIDGRLGNGDMGVTSTPAAVSGGHRFRSVAAGFSAVCGVATDDAVWCWGQGANGQLGQVLINGSPTPVRAGGALRAADVSTANVSGGEGSYSCAIAADRLTTYCWGRNDKGQLGNGTTTDHVAVNAAPSIVVGQKPLPATR
jgi:alpha-tubulin suppressor-like RCC1 family protein